MAEMTPNEALAVLNRDCAPYQDPNGKEWCNGCNDPYPCEYRQAVDVLAAEIGRLSPELIAALAAHVEASAAHRHLHRLPLPKDQDAILARWQVVDVAAVAAGEAELRFMDLRREAIYAECARLAEAGSGDGDGDKA